MASYTIPIFLLLALIFHNTNGAIFTIQNNCPYTVWAGAVPGGGQPLNPGQPWHLNVAPGTAQARIWPRTNCNFDGSGRGSCETVDCNGVLQCQTYGATPNTVAEFALNQFANFDYFDISVIDGFNVPMKFSPNSSPGTGTCRSIGCTIDINSQCPNELRARGGCNSACTVFKTQEYCCYTENCGETNYSRFFKDHCPDVYSYKNDKTATFACPGGTDYMVVFCP